jgi:hypothetical protein
MPLSDQALPLVDQAGVRIGLSTLRSAAFHRRAQDSIAPALAEVDA